MLSNVSLLRWQVTGRDVQQTSHASETLNPSILLSMPCPWLLLFVLTTKLWPVYVTTDCGYALLQSLGLPTNHCLPSCPCFISRKGAWRKRSWLPTVLSMPKLQVRGLRQLPGPCTMTLLSLSFLSHVLSPWRHWWLNWAEKSRACNLFVGLSGGKRESCMPYHEFVPLGTISQANGCSRFLRLST